MNQLTTPVLLKTLYIVKLPHSPMPYTANTSVFGYKKLADAQHQVESKASWFQPALEVWAIHIRGPISETGDERVLMAAGADVERIELRKRYKGGGQL